MPLSLWFVPALAAGCHGPAEESLSKAQPEQEVAIPNVPMPPEEGPRLGAIGNITPIYDRPATTGSQVGYLHAGATVARAVEPYSTVGCDSGWFPVRPRGFVCADTTATTDLKHATLAAMAIAPNLQGAVPYTYARVTKKGNIYAADPDRDQTVRAVGELPQMSGLAVVGSWKAQDPEGHPLRLGMMTDGRFVDASHLESAELSEFVGVNLDEQQTLPVGFVLKRGVRAWTVDGYKAKKERLLAYHSHLSLAGRFRTVHDVKFWEMTDGRWVRHKDVTVIERRHTLPAFVNESQKWIDISVITGSMVVYEGKQPIYASLVTVGRDRLGDPQNSDATARGEFAIVGKHITAAASDPGGFASQADMYDVPWVLELSSGQLLHGAYWHDYFGIEHGPGHIQLSPADARFVWHWADPELPNGWHGVGNMGSARSTLVNIRK